MTIIILCNEVMKFTNAVYKYILASSYFIPIQFNLNSIPIQCTSFLYGISKKISKIGSTFNA